MANRDLLNPILERLIIKLLYGFDRRILNQGTVERSNWQNFVRTR